MLYDLIGINDLEYDLKYILKKIDSMYEIRFEKNKMFAKSIIKDNSGAYWVTEESTIAFNKEVPQFKSIHRDMYAFIESVSRLKHKKFNTKYYEEKYKDFKEFRLLNNMFKHPEKKALDIKFSKVVNFNQATFDLLVNFFHPNSNKSLMYTSFIFLFFRILSDHKIISIEVT